MTMKEIVRYQHQPWYKKVLLSIRYEIFVPLSAFIIWYDTGYPPREEFKLTYKLCWGIAKGKAAMKKNHYYTWEEIRSNLESKTNANKSTES